VKTLNLSKLAGLI